LPVTWPWISGVRKHRKITASIHLFKKGPGDADSPV
jgi:hypothetical protein